MGDLRKYIELIETQQQVEETRGKAVGKVLQWGDDLVKKFFPKNSAKPIVGTEVKASDGLIYRWEGQQWVQKAGQVGGKGRIATKAVSAELSKAAAKKGSLIVNAIKKNPRLAAAIASALALVGTATYIRNQDSDPAPEPAPGPAPNPAPNPAPAPAPAPGPTPPEQSGKEDELAALKAQIDALIKELQPSTDEEVKRELQRIIRKYQGQSGVQQSGKPAEFKPAPGDSSLSSFDQMYAGTGLK
jgi:hypothetical protein